MRATNRDSRSSVRTIANCAIQCALLSCVLFLLAACRSDPDPLRIGVLAWPPYDLAHLAVDEGLISRSSYDLVNFQTPSEVVRSFRYGLIDAMFVTSHFALSAIRDVGDVRIIYIVDVSLGGDALLVRPGFESAEALEGARIGVESAPLGIYTLVRALGQLGLSSGDISIVNVDTPQQLDAWQDGSVDALVAYEPTRSKIKREGGIEIFNSESIPYEILDVLVVRQSMLDERRGDLSRFIGALDQALTQFREDIDAVSERFAKRHALTAGEFRDAMASVELFDIEDNLSMLNDPSHPVLDALRKQCRVMVQAGMLRTEPDLEPLLDASVVKMAAGR